KRCRQYPKSALESHSFATIRLASGSTWSFLTDVLAMEIQRQCQRQRLPRDRRRLELLLREARIGRHSQRALESHGFATMVNQSRNVLESFVRVSAFLIQRIIGRRREIVPRPAAQSRHCKGGGFTHVQPLPNGLKISSRGGAVINAVTTKSWVCYGIPGKGGGIGAGGALAIADEVRHAPDLPIQVRHPPQIALRHDRGHIHQVDVVLPRSRVPPKDVCLSIAVKVSGSDDLPVLVGHGAQVALSRFDG